jgi:molybdenum-dependent DNA-binding transcriptional regulator ModE
MLTEDDLALLKAIRTTTSLSRAAAKLGKAPSTVSHAARQLETRLDALLFDRRRYRLQLTPAGALLAQEAARIGDDVARLTRRVKQVAGGWEDRLSIVMDEILEFETMLPVIRSTGPWWSATPHGAEPRSTACSAARRRWPFPPCAPRSWRSAMAWASAGCRWSVHEAS